MTSELRQYRATIVGASVDDRLLSAPRLLTSNGVSVEVDEGRVVLRMAVSATDAKSALRAARETADDFFRALAASYAPFRIDPHDERDEITRTDATYVSDGPIPEGDVAEGGVFGEGWDLIDPTGEKRRAGKVARVRASAQVSHDVQDDFERFERRSAWGPRLRAALGLYWAGQCSPDPQVRFVLAMAALEVLAERPAESLLAVRLTADERRDVRAAVREVLVSAGLGGRDVDRLVSRMMDTQERGATEAIVLYINERIPDESGTFGGDLDAAEVRKWQGLRGSYLHSGPLDETSQQARERLNLFVGEALRRELDDTLDIDGSGA